MYSEFESAKCKIASEISNEYTIFEAQPISIIRIKERRGEINLQEAKICAAIAYKMYKRASMVEPSITRTIIDAVSKSGGVMYGLQFRLKQPNSMAGKIAFDSIEKNINYFTASKAINDSIRYTAILDDDNFVDAYDEIKKRLHYNGYEEIKCKNYFELYKEGKSMHKSVQSIFKTEDGDVFELQFQTIGSQSAKELKLPLYEERRKFGISETRANELELCMRRLADMIQDPRNICKILSH